MCPQLTFHNKTLQLNILFFSQQTDWYTMTDIHTQRIPPHYHNTVNIAELCIKNIVLGWTLYTLNMDKHYQTPDHRLKDGGQFLTWKLNVASFFLRVLHSVIKKQYSLTIKLTLTFKNGCQDRKYSCSILDVFNQWWMKSYAITPQGILNVQ